MREVIARIGDHPIARLNELLPFNLKASHIAPLAGNKAILELPT